MGDQPVAEAATYTTFSEDKRRTSMLIAGFEPAVVTLEQPTRLGCVAGEVAL
jgi:hypothetical protein